MPFPLGFPCRNVRQLFDNHATPVSGRTVGLKPGAAASCELIHQRLQPTPLGTEDMRAHLPDISVIGRDHDVFINDRLTNHLINVIGSLSATRHISQVYCATFLSKVHCCLSLLEAASSLLHLGHPILRLDLVTPIFAENSALGRLRRRHRRVHGDLAFGFDHALHF